MSFFDKMIEIAKSMGVKNFAYYKKWALDHLKKQLDEDKQVTKAIEWCEEYLEKAYGVGTIRTWKGKKYIKGPDKKWRRYYDKHGRGTSIAISHIMKQINALEDGDFEGLYEIIQKNAGRFRDQNGNVLPEVQQIHDLVEKKQTDGEKKKGENELLKYAKENRISTKETAYISQVKKIKEDYEKNPVNESDRENIEKNIRKNKRELKRYQEIYNKEGDLDALEVAHFRADLLLVYSQLLKELDNKKEEREETEQEKHDNRSNAMLGNDNAKKDGVGEEWDESYFKANVDGIKNKLKDKSETEVKKYFTWLDKQFADKPENSYEKRAIAQAKADYYGDSAFNDTNLEKVADKYANNKKVDKLINDTTVDSFVCDDKTGTRYFMTGVYNDPDGYKVATDGHYLYAEKADIPEDKTGQIINKDGQKIEGIFPNWKRVIPDNAPKTDLFDDKKGLMKLCLIGNKISKLTKNVPCKVKVGDFAYDSKLLGKVLAIADKQGLNNVSVTGNGQILFEGDKGKATLAGMAFDFGGSYLDANDKMFYGAQPDAVKEFLGTSEDVKKSFVSQIRKIMQKSGPAEPKHDLEFYKKWALSILDKQKEEPENEDEPNEETIVKALAYTEMIAKAGYPVGTIREWKGKKYIKVAPNQWKPKYDKVDRGAKMSLGHLKKAVANANSEEELYNIINSNASRFRDENGRPFPEVQELHDLVTKRQGELNPGENSGENGTETSGAAGNGGTSSKGKGKTSYADQIAAIQKLGKKAESAVQNTGSGHVDNAIENAANDVVESTKNAAKKEDTKKKTAAEIVDTGKEMTDEDKDKWLKQFEGGEENGPEESKKAGEVSREDKISAISDFLNSQTKIKENWEELFKNQPDDFIDMKYNEVLSAEKKKKTSGYTELPKEEIKKMDRQEYHNYMEREQKDIPMDKIGPGGGHIKDLETGFNICKKIANTFGNTKEGIKKLEDFLVYNTKYSSKMHDQLIDKLGMDYSLLDADRDLAYKNAMKLLLGKKTAKDVAREKQAIEQYEDNMSAALDMML